MLLKLLYDFRFRVGRLHAERGPQTKDAAKLVTWRRDLVLADPELASPGTQSDGRRNGLINQRDNSIFPPRLQPRRFA
jgi:hypothetical protein